MDFLCVKTFFLGDKLFYLQIIFFFLSSIVEREGIIVYFEEGNKNKDLKILFGNDINDLKKSDTQESDVQNAPEDERK